jgi:hypothetical protein
MLVTQEDVTPMMKTFRILALVAMLALVFSYKSAQAQNQDTYPQTQGTTTMDQSTTQPTDQDATPPATAGDSDSDISVQQNQPTSTDTLRDTDQYNRAGHRRFPSDDRESNRLQEIENDSGAG